MKKLIPNPPSEEQAKAMVAEYERKRIAAEQAREQKHREAVARWEDGQARN